MIKKSAAAVLGIGLVLIAAALVLHDLRKPAAPVAEGTVRGEVLLGPVCPVERMPPDPRCAPRPYAGAPVAAFAAGDDSGPRAAATADASGTFEFELPAGSYAVRVQGRSFYPRCGEAAVTVAAGAEATTTISCDTGIR